MVTVGFLLSKQKPRGIFMKKLKTLLTDFIYGCIGLVIMNAVMSLLVNPYLGKKLGAAGQGKILFYTSLASLLAGSFGSALNYGRMKIDSAEHRTENGEFNRYLLWTLGITAVVTMIAVFVKGDTAGTSYIGLLAVIFITIVRYYADVEFRLSLNYRHFSLYYILIAAGYGLGLLLYPLTGSWVLILLLGEAAGIVYVIFGGHIFRKPFFRKTEDYTAHLKTVSTLTGSYLLAECAAAADRILIPLLAVNGDAQAAIFYYASLVGKMMSLLSTPLNGVLAGHLAKSEEEMTRKRFLRILALMTGVFVLVTAVSVVGSHIFVRLFYRDCYETAKPLFLLANAGQVIFFICNTLMVIVLRYTDEKYQIIVSVIYAVLFFALAVPLTVLKGMYGMGYAILIANIAKFLLFGIVGMIGLKGKNDEKENG